MRALIIGFALLFSCSGCAIRQQQRPLIVHVSFASQAALYNLFAATTGQPNGPEIGLCAVGHIIQNVAYVTSVVVPYYQTGNTRNSINQLSCEGILNVLGRIHFHPDHPAFGGDLPCRRSPVDEISHARSGYAIDIVQCSRARFRWYTMGAQGGRD